MLVFGAGTNYALLLISRYRQELRRHSEHRDALRRAVRMAGPAIVASNATVVLALLTLLFASTPSTRSLGALARVRAGRRRGVGSGRAAAAARAVRPAIVLALHSAPRATAPPLDSGALAPGRRLGGPASCPGRGDRDRGTGGPGHRPAGNPDRLVADRAVPGASGFGVRLRRCGRALSGRSGQSHARRRPHRPGSPGPAGDQFHPWRGLGDRGGPFDDRADEVVGGHRRPRRHQIGIQYRCGTASFDQSR